MSERQTVFSLILFFAGTFLIFLLIFFISFYQLDYYPIHVFDESRNAVNAIEMHLNGNFIYTTYDGLPETWNTKPPFLIWLQALLISAIGYTEWAIRLPSAFAGIGTAFLIFMFSYRCIKDLCIALVAPLTLFSIKGFVAIHALRSGDYDALLTMMTTGLLLIVYVYYITQNKILLYAASVFLTLGLLTKGIAAFLFLPGMFLFVLIQNKIRPLLSSRTFWITALIPVLVGLSYYLIRESVTPGYLKAVQMNELGGRFNQALEGNSGSPAFYIKLLWHDFLNKKQFIVALLALPLSYITKKHIKLSLYLFILCATFLTFLSISQTKLQWYLVPIYPILAMLIAIFISNLCVLICRFFTKDNLKIVFPILAFTFISGNPLIANINSVRKPEKPKNDTAQLCYYLKEVKKGKAKLDTTYTFLNFEHYYPHIGFYTEGLNIKNLKISNLNDFELDQLPQKVAATDPRIFDILQQRYELRITDQQKQVRFFEIQKVKNNWGNWNLQYNNMIFENDTFALFQNQNQKSDLIVIKKSNHNPPLALVFKTKKNETIQTEVVKVENWKGLKTKYYNSARFIYLQNDFVEFIP